MMQHWGPGWPGGWGLGGGPAGTGRAGCPDQAPDLEKLEAPGAGRPGVGRGGRLHGKVYSGHRQLHVAELCSVHPPGRQAGSEAAAGPWLLYGGQARR